jgi:sigma-E factor negative regulatory protein RseC
VIEQQATVIQIEDDTIWLQAERQSTCSQCQIKQGCGTGLLAKHVGKRFSKIAVNKTAETTVGQVVTLAIPEQALLQGAALMYLLPLALLFLFSIVTRAFQLGEGLEILAGLAGLITGFIWVKQHLRNKKDGIQAKVVEE